MEQADVMPYVWTALAAFGAWFVRVAAKVAPSILQIAETWVTNWIREVENKQVRDMLNLAKEEVRDVVHSVSQTMVPEIRAAAEDGKISQDERQKLMVHVVGRVRERLGQDWWHRFSETALGESAREGEEPARTASARDRWIAEQAEAEVFRMLPMKEAARRLENR
jgi:hypothetical protein